MPRNALLFDPDDSFEVIWNRDVAVGRPIYDGSGNALNMREGERFRIRAADPDDWTLWSSLDIDAAWIFKAEWVREALVGRAGYWHDHLQRAPFPVRIED